ncbi:MAG: FecR family protein [Woeseiaceae bacterium]|nr:FecR family protein [Woeseiaceae bacterium]
MKTVNDLESDIRSDEALEALFARAAPRPLPRADREIEIREQVRLAWQRSVRRRQYRRYTLLAIAASVALVTAVGMLWYQSPLLPPDVGPVAMVDKRFGDLHIADASGVRFVPSDGPFALLPGQAIETGDNSGLAMTWNNGGSLRLDEFTSISVTAANEIYLQRGRVYFDSDPITSNAAIVRGGGPDVLAIRTDHGLVTPLGTRYVTQQQRDSLVVLVRQGKVSVNGTGFSANALEGERLLVSTGDEPVVVPADAYGEEWAWIEKTTPAWNAEGRTIFEFLDWVSRESGRPIRFDSPMAEQLARTETLVGYGVVELEPSVALRIVLMTTDLDWAIKDGAVVVSERQPDVSAVSN